MKVTKEIDDNLFENARGITGIRNQTALVNAGLQVLVERECARRLAQLGGAEPQVEPIPRRRS